MNDIDFHDLGLFQKLENLHGYPMKVSMFERYPTALKMENIPKIFLSSYFMNTLVESNGYGGLDGIVLGNLAKAMNFTAIISTPMHSDFGYKLNNGSFVGTFEFFCGFCVFCVFFVVWKMKNKKINWSFRFDRRRSLSKYVCLFQRTVYNRIRHR